MREEDEMKAIASVVSVLVLAASAAPTASAANLLFNPSFEEPGSLGFLGGEFPFTATLPGWRLTGVGNGGGFSQLLGVDNGTATGKDGNNFAYNVRGVFETLDVNRPAVIAGETYQFSFIAEADFSVSSVQVNTSAAFSIDWYTSTSGYTPLSSTPASIVTITENGGTFLPYVGATGVAPLGATFAAVRYDTTLAAIGGDGGNAWFDAASLTQVVPEPAVLGTVLTLFPLILRRRSMK